MHSSSPKYQDHLPLCDILQTSSNFNLDIVEEYRTKIRRGEEIQRVYVRRYKDDPQQRYRLLDGNHRFEAHKLEKQTTICAVTR